MSHRSPDVAQDQIDDPSGSGREAQDAQLMIHKDRGDARASEQVVHVVVGARQIHHLRLKLGVDRREFFVHRLQFFLGSL